jgi:hypothetical protein
MVMQAGSTGKAINLVDAKAAYGIWSGLCAASGVIRADASTTNKRQPTRRANFIGTLLLVIRIGKV